MPLVTVLMPTYRQANFIERALDSLVSQTLEDWELYIIDDGSPDQTEALVLPWLADRRAQGRIHYHRLERNQGMGAALNYGIERAGSAYIAYLPSDDVYYASHLQGLVECLESEPGSPLAYSGVRHHYNRIAPGQVEGYPLQLVQVMHRKNAARWTERQELESDDLERLMWGKLRGMGSFQGTGQVTCEWVDHPHQRHKILREPVGGINTFRSYYAVSQPLRMHTTVGNFMDEGEHYRIFRERPDTPRSPDGLKILLVGELAYNAERVLALEERGHQLFGLWMPEPYWYNTVGPLPFGHVTDLPSNDWRSAIRKVQPDVIYALLNWQAVPFVHEVLQAVPEIPFIWHYKEGPFISLEKGHWSQLIDLHRYSDGQIFSSPEMRAWYETVLPGITRDRPTLDLDGDLPKREWFAGKRSPRLSQLRQDGELHTVVPGRPIGLHPGTVADLAAQRIHLHFYGDFVHGQWLEWIEKTRRLAPGYIHLHHNVDQEHWVEEFSQYDAGWLHFFESQNGGELRRANWDDLNYPARIATLVAAGLPVLQRDNPGAIVATQNLARGQGLGIFFTTMEGLRQQLEDEGAMGRLREHIWAQREQFTFDAHAGRLEEFFRQVRAGFRPHRQAGFRLWGASGPGRLNLEEKLYATSKNGHSSS